jgi:hypothetical protein
VNKKSLYKLLGFTAWQGGKWYLRRRTRHTRMLVITGVGGAGALVGAAAIARRSLKQHSSSADLPRRSTVGILAGMES